MISRLVCLARVCFSRPITHEELVETIKEWEADGASCPTQ
jgi:hypothetical protein